MCLLCWPPIYISIAKELVNQKQDIPQTTRMTNTSAIIFILALYNIVDADLSKYSFLNKF